jgi:hypothetical protein
MNTFFIILFCQLFEEKNTNIFPYLSEPFSCSKGNTATTFVVKEYFANKIRSESSYIQYLLSHYIVWLEGQREKTMKVHTPCNKKYVLLQNILQNIFISVNMSEEIVGCFGRTQKHFLALNRFAYIWKYKRANVCADTDFSLNDIDMKKKNVFILYQNRKLYYFIISDLMKIIENSLCTHYEDTFIVNVQKPSNPYNRIVFGTHDLYNIYFYMRMKMSISIPYFFHTWFLEGFNLGMFVMKHETWLRKMCIRKYTWNVENTNELVHDDILEMLSDNKHTRRWNIHSKFPRSTLIDTMRPYLYLYYLLSYNVLDNDEHVLYDATLALELMKFYKFNPQFGRRYMKINRSSFEFSKIYTFNFPQLNSIVQPNVSEYVFQETASDITSNLSEDTQSADENVHDENNDDENNDDENNDDENNDDENNDDENNDDENNDDENNDDENDDDENDNDVSNHDRIDIESLGKSKMLFGKSTKKEFIFNTKARVFHSKHF